MLDAPVLIDRPSVVNIHYVDHRKARWTRASLAVVGLAGLATALVGIAAERMDVTLSGAGLYVACVGAGFLFPRLDEARVDVRPR